MTMTYLKKYSIMPYGKSKKNNLIERINGYFAVITFSLFIGFLGTVFITKEIQDFRNTYTIVKLDPNNVDIMRPVDVLTDADYRQIMCLAKNLYFEARGESDEGIKAVALVTINRAVDHKFPDSICQVVYQAKVKVDHTDPSKVVPYKHQCQFSWFCDGKPDEIKDKNSWDRVYNIAYNMYVHYDKIHDFTDGATYYHADYVSPYWSKKFDKTVKVDRHIFYKVVEYN